MNHVLLLENVGPEALKNGNIKLIYAAVSEPVRSMIMASIRAKAMLIGYSRLTQRTAETVKMLYPDYEKVVEVQIAR